MSKQDAVTYYLNGDMVTREKFEGADPEFTILDNVVIPQSLYHEINTKPRSERQKSKNLIRSLRDARKRLEELQALRMNPMQGSTDPSQNPDTIRRSPVPPIERPGEDDLTNAEIIDPQGSEDNESVHSDTSQTTSRSGKGGFGGNRSEKHREKIVNVTEETSQYAPRVKRVVTRPVSVDSTERPHPNLDFIMSTQDVFRSDLEIENTWGDLLRGRTVTTEDNYVFDINNKFRYV